MALTVNYNEEGIPNGVPTYLFDQVALYQEDPMAAARAWFTKAGLGLSVFFGLHGLLGRHEDVIEREEMPFAEYAELEKQLTAKNFDAIDIAELAIAAGARYIVFPAVYDDGFSLYNTTQTDFNSVHSPAHRDFVGELASVCEYHGLGLGLEYSLGINYHKWPKGIPATDVAAYFEFIHSQLHELLTQYGPIAMVSFNGLRRIRQQFPAWSPQDLYDLVHGLQPSVLVAFRQGHTGTEDYYTVSEKLPNATDDELTCGFVLANSPKKPLEIRQSLTPGGRGFNAGEAGHHLKIDALRQCLRNARQAEANLLINTALMPDGSLDLEDINTLLEFGKKK